MPHDIVELDKDKFILHTLYGKHKFPGIMGGSIPFLGYLGVRQCECGCVVIPAILDPYTQAGMDEALDWWQAGSSFEAELRRTAQDKNLGGRDLIEVICEMHRIWGEYRESTRHRQP